MDQCRSSTVQCTFNQYYCLSPVTQMLQGYDVDLVGRFSFNPKSRRIRLIHQMERRISVWFDRNTWDQLWRLSALTGLVISVGLTEMSLSIWQNCYPQYPSFVYILLTRTINIIQTRGGLWQVCATGRESSAISNRNFLLKGKRQGFQQGQRSFSIF